MPDALLAALSNAMEKLQFQTAGNIRTVRIGHFVISEEAKHRPNGFLGIRKKEKVQNISENYNRQLCGAAGSS